jgi:hypothetical protein
LCKGVSNPFSIFGAKLVDGGLDGGVESGLVGEGSGAVFLSLEAVEVLELIEEGEGRGGVVPEFSWRIQEANATDCLLF